MRTAQKVAANVDAVFVLLRNSVVEEQRQEQDRAYRRKACVVNLAAVPGSFLGVSMSSAPKGR
jgi:hypothetical protein